MRLTESRMRDYAKSFLMKNYGLSLDVPLELNGRLRTTFGRFVYTKFKNSKSIPKTIQ